MYGNIPFELQRRWWRSAKFKTWTEVFDGKHTHVDIDLIALNGQSVEFILEIENNDNTSEDDRAFWLVPMIVR